LIGDELEKTEALSEIVKAQTKARYYQKAQSALEEPLQNAEQIGDNLRKVWALSSIVQAQAQAGDTEGALQNARQIGDDLNKVGALIPI